MRELLKSDKKVALALGYFDCVHYAHRQIISAAVESAGRIGQGCKSAVLTFCNSPASKNSLPVYAFKERKRLIGEIGADFLLPLNFDEVLKNLTPIQFLEFLFDGYNIKHIVCGSDYRFGRDGMGNVEILQDFAAKKGASVQVFDPICMNGEVVSSSLVKSELENGNIKKVNQLLCAPYFLEGKVVRGKGRGQSLGYPTANIRPSEERFCPKFGVYKSRSMVGDTIYDSLTSIGNKPTFGDDAVTIETFLKGDVFNIYNKIIHVELIDFVRELVKFKGVSQLKAQLKRDIAENLD